MAWSGGLPLRKNCANHVFEIASEARPIDYGSGYAQIATCMVCEDPGIPLDAGWYRDLATDQQVQECIWICERERVRLYKVIGRLEGPEHRATMRLARRSFEPDFTPS